jgi:hypothetical protein
MDGSRTVHYQINADDTISGWLTEKTPILVARCYERKVEAFLVTGMPMRPELGKFQKYTVRLRFDDGSPRTEVWDDSTDDKAIFAPQPSAFLKRVEKAKILRMEVTPFNANPGVATFHFGGFAGPLAAINEACRGKRKR